MQQQLLAGVLGLLVLRYEVVKLDSLSAENVQRRAEREIDLAVRQLVDKGEVAEFLRAARIGARNRDPGSESCTSAHTGSYSPELQVPIWSLYVFQTHP
jgi:hypothetical protein